MSSRKQIFKHHDGVCYFCGENDYNLLDCHRIVEGKNGGKYTRENSITVCSLCHRKIHTERIKILGRHFTSAGKYILHYIEDEKELWK